MPSRTLTIRRDKSNSTVSLHLQPGAILEKTVESELLQIVFSHNDGFTEDGNIKNQKLIDHGPLLFNGGGGLGGMEVPEDKYEAVRSDLESRGYTFTPARDVASPDSEPQQKQHGEPQDDLQKCLDELVPEATVQNQFGLGYSVIVDSLLTDYTWMKFLKGRILVSLKLQTTNLTDGVLIKFLPGIRSVKLLNVAHNRDITGDFLNILPDDYQMEAIALEGTASGDAALVELIRIRNISLIWANSRQFSEKAKQAIPSDRALEIRIIESFKAL